MSPKSNEHALIKDRNERYREESHVKMEMETGVFAATSQRMPEATRIWES